MTASPSVFIGPGEGALHESDFHLRLSAYDEEMEAKRDKILTIRKWRDRSDLQKAVRCAAT